MPKFKKNPNPIRYKKPSGFKMRMGNSPLKNKDEVETKTRTRKNIFTGNTTVIETQEVDGVKRKIKTTYNKKGDIIKQKVVKKGGGEIKLGS